MRYAVRIRDARRRLVALAVASTVLLFAPAAFGGTTGKISGTVVDKAKKPVVAATVALTGQPYGAYTSADGHFNILNVPPGTYEVRLSRVGLKPYVIAGVIVSADNTTSLDVVMQDAGITTETVVVRATRPPVDIALTSSVQSVQSKDIEQLPVQELQDVVNLQAGVVNGHFRGGRVGEVQFQVDGVSVNNPYDNSSSLRVDRSLLQEVQVMSGTFDAEYGQAMSGVVNAVLKNGTRDFQWHAEVYGGGYGFPGHNSTRHVSDTFQPDAVRNFTVTSTGPLGPKVTFLANLRRYGFDDFVSGERLYQPQPTPVLNDQGAQVGTIPTAGDGSTVALGYSDEWSGAAKISATPIHGVKLSYQALVNVLDGRTGSYRFRFDPDGQRAQHIDVLIHGLDCSATLGKATYLDASLRQTYFTYEDFVYANLLDPRYAVGPPVELPNDPGTVVWGVDLGRFKQTTDAF